VELYYDHLTPHGRSCKGDCILSAFIQVKLRGGIFNCALKAIHFYLLSVTADMQKDRPILKKVNLNLPMPNFMTVESISSPDAASILPCLD